MIITRDDGSKYHVRKFIVYELARNKRPKKHQGIRVLNGFVPLPRNWSVTNIRQLLTVEKIDE